MSAPSVVHEVLRSPGQPLPSPVRTFFEPRFGADFSQVRVHTNAAAQQSAQDINANAYTAGQNIVFATGRFAPETQEGRQLLAHELTHVLQQQKAPSADHAVHRDATAPEPFRLDAPDPATQNVSVGEPPQPEPENVSRGEPEAMPDVPEAVCRPEADLVCEREGPPEPLGQTIEFEHLVFAANTDYLDWLFRYEVRFSGLDKTAALVRRFLMSQGLLGTALPPRSDDKPQSAIQKALRGFQERSWPEIALAVNDAYFRVERQVTSFLASYKKSAEANLTTLLNRSEARVDAERIRYGLQSKEDILHYWSPLRLDAEMRRNPQPEDVTPALKELATAAGILAELRLQLDVTSMEREVVRYRAVSQMILTNDIPTFQSAAITVREQTRAIADDSRAYDFRRAELTERYPILAAYENDPAKLRLLATGDSLKVIVELHDKIYKVLTNIASVRKDLADGDINIWKLPRLIAATNLSLGIEGGSLEAALVEQKIQDENDESFWNSIGLGILQVGLVLAAPFTGGLSLIPAAAISGAMLVRSVSEYQQQSALAGTDFDRALAIAAEEPSLFWVAMDAVLFITDAFGALRAFRTVKALLAEYRAAATVDKAEEVLSRLERAATEDGSKAFAERVVAGARSGKGSGVQDLFSARHAEALEEAAQAATRAASEKVLFERVTVAGTLKITPGGHIMLCASPCRWLREVFARALTESPDLEARLTRIEQDVQGALARADTPGIEALGIQTQTLMRDLVKETVGDLPLNRAQVKVLNDIEAVLDARGLGWSDLGFGDRSELVEVLSTPGRADDVLARLRQRAESAVPGEVATQGAARRVTTRPISAEADIDTWIETARPRIDRPPASVTTPDDLVMWEQYNAYFDERVASMRTDFRTRGLTERMPPHNFDRFRQVYTENPELLAALRGRLTQGWMGNIIDELSGSKVVQNLGVSRVAAPGRREVVYADFVMTRQGKPGYTAVSNKSRQVAETASDAELVRMVNEDIKEGVEKYYGRVYVRRPGIDLTGERILIDELVLNYDPNLIPPKFYKRMRQVARAYSGTWDVKIGFFIEP